MIMDDSLIQAFTVSQINQKIKDLIEGEFSLNRVCIKGELSNYKIYPSGHHYFTIKDAESSLKCVMFRSYASKMTVRPKDGMMVFAMGRISVYPRDGCYQLYCDGLLESGRGDLMLQFEKIKNKLAEKGYFDLDQKKKLPDYPQRVGIITSPAGAAVHDMIRIIRKRFPVAEIQFFPVHVQGEEAVGDIVNALELANRYASSDVLILGRGGGSMEDLWAFNSELIAEAIHSSVIPVISAVGHEPDVTISDFVADYRAATPTHGAELAVPDSEELLRHVNKLSDGLFRKMESLLQLSHLCLDKANASLFYHDPDKKLKDSGQYLDRLTQELINSLSKNIDKKSSELSYQAGKLDSLSPLKVLSRGYSILCDKENRTISSVRRLSTGDVVDIRLSDGRANAIISDVSEVSE